jgi:hypothetical protein
LSNDFLQLAHSMLVLFDPTLEGFSPEPVSMEEDQLVPIYKQAKMYSALLPGKITNGAVIYIYATRKSPPLVVKRIGTFVKCAI